MYPSAYESYLLRPLVKVRHDGVQHVDHLGHYCCFHIAVFCLYGFVCLTYYGFNVMLMLLFSLHVDHLGRCHRDSQTE